MKKIVFVCTGNSCRSPMLEHLLRHKIKERGLSGRDYSVSSAAIMAIDGQLTSENTIAVLKNAGIKATPRPTKQLNKRLVNKNTILIGVTNSHKDWIMNLPNAYALSDFVQGLEVADVYGLPVQEYQKAYDVFNNVTEIILDKLVNDEI